MSDLEMTQEDRRAVYLAEKIRQLQGAIKVGRQGVQEGFGAMLIPIVDQSFDDWLATLEADLLEAEAELEFLIAKRGAMQ